MNNDWKQWETLEELPLQDADAIDDTLVVGNSIFGAVEAVAEVRDDGTETIVEVQEQQKDMLYGELHRCRERIAALEARVARLEALLGDHADKGEPR